MITFRTGLTWFWPFIVSNVVMARATCVRCTNNNMKVQVSCNDPQAFVTIVRGSFEKGIQIASLKMAQFSSSGSGRASMSSHRSVNENGISANATHISR